MAIKEISLEKAYKLINENNNNENFIILDTRTQPEFEKKHLRKAININFISKSFKEKIKELDKEKTYLVYCRTGNRSKKAIKIMENEGFKNIYHIEEGIIKIL